MATPTANISKRANVPRSAGERPGAVRYVWAAARLSLASVFLWAFLDKTFGLGYSTKPERAWVEGGSPTMGFLSNAKGWFAEVFHAMAGNALVDWLFMLGLLGVGVALLLGVGMRIAAISGATMMVLMYVAATPGVAGTTHPVLDSHIVYALILVGLALAGAGRTLGLGDAWSRLALVKKYPILE